MVDLSRGSQISALNLDTKLSKTPAQSTAAYTEGVMTPKRVIPWLFWALTACVVGGAVVMQSWNCRETAHVGCVSFSDVLASSSSLSPFQLWSSVLFEQRMWPCQNTLLTVRLGYDKWRVVWVLESESTKGSVRQQIAQKRVDFWFQFSGNR